MIDDKTREAEAAFINRLLAGVPAAFDQLVGQFHAPMIRVAAAIIGDSQAEEVVQESWLAVIRALPNFQARSSLKTWLFTIVSNEAKGRLRKGKREEFINDLSGGEVLFETGRFVKNGHWVEAPGLWHDNTPEALFSFEEFRRCLDKTLDRLPELQRAVLTLREYQGMELEEICNILDISASNIRVLVHRARLSVYAMAEHFEETGQC